jgi:hypothetical protein
VIRVTPENEGVERFQAVDDAVRFLETREGLRRGDLEWVRVQLRYELRVDVLPPITREEYTLEVDTDWFEAS